MELLLFLSAILTGAITGTRAAEPQQMSASSIAAPAIAAARKTVRAMPAASAHPLADRPAETASFFVAAAAPTLVPIFADRRRE